jgi:hypothetical protein
LVTSADAAPLETIDDYHVINRGNNRQDVFHKEEDFQALLRALGDLTPPWNLPVAPRSRWSASGAASNETNSD